MSDSAHSDDANGRGGTTTSQDAAPPPDLAALGDALGVPEPPGYKVDFDALDERLWWVRRLRGCEQDAQHHAEGDVWIHTRLVLERLCELDDWRALPAARRALVFAAALLHDVAKPDCTRREDERVTARGHSRRGEQLARTILWRLDAPLRWRESVCALVLHHQVPFFLLERDDPRRLALRISLRARCDDLALLAEADARGRRCDDQQRILDNVALFVEHCKEQRCLSAPARFASDHGRFLFFRHKSESPDYEPYESGDEPRVTVMSGLPGAGKDSWIARDAGGLPVVSLDAWRERLGVAADKPQGRVINAAREQAREHLRAGAPFVWNATNISRQQRASVIDLCAGYQARVRVVYLDLDEPSLRERNAARPGRAAVPDAVIDRLLRRWQPPDLSEAHGVLWHDAAGSDVSPEA